MYRTKRGFTLLEMLVSIAISTVLLLIATDRFITGAYLANNSYNQNVDLQTGVKNSVDNVKKILKKSIQIHLVGKEVYKPDMNLNALDENYNYIGFREENGHRFLANIVYNSKKKKFDVIPLTASEKIDIMHKNDIKYELSLYRDENNYKNKLEKNMINFTVKGISKTDETRLKNKEFELTESLFLPNVNQILISRHLQGGINDITAIAYDDGIIRPGQGGGGGGNKNIGIVFILDSSQSMQNTLNDEFPMTDDGTNFKFINIKKFPWSDHKTAMGKEGNKSGTLNDIYNVSNSLTTRRYVAGLSINEKFLPKLNEMGKNNNIDIDAYIYDYNTELKSMEITEPGNMKGKYLFKLSDLEKNKYGPYKLNENITSEDMIKYKDKEDERPKKFEDAKERITGDCEMSFNVSDHKLSDGYYNVFNKSTNTGLALLQGFEILKQLRDKGIEKRFLVLLTDGVPSVRTYYDGPWKENLISRKKYNEYNGFNGWVLASKFENDYENEYSEAMKYVDEVTHPINGNNEEGLYEKAYIIGYSNLDKDKKKIGYPDKNGSIPVNSLNAYLRRSGNEVHALDSIDKITLDLAFENIVKDIGVNLAVFDGPNKMKTL